MRSFPRPSDGETITANNGRYGPYVYKNLDDGKTDSRSLEAEDQLRAFLFGRPHQCRPSSIISVAINVSVTPCYKTRHMVSCRQEICH